MREFYLRNRKDIKFIIYAVLIILGVYLVKISLCITAPFIVGYLLSLLFQPLAGLLKKAKAPGWAAAAVPLLLFLLFLGFLASLFWDALNQRIISGNIGLPSFEDADRVIAELLSVLPEKLRNVISCKNISIKGIFEGLSIDLAGGIAAVPRAIIRTVICFVSAFFFTKDRDKMRAALMAHMPEETKKGLVFARDNFFFSIIAYITAQLKIMIFTFSICITGLFLIGSPRPMFLSAVITLIDAIPFFGSGFILWPGALYHAINGRPYLAAGYMAIYFCVIIMRQIAEPKILGSHIGLHPLVTLFSMYAGLHILGIFGMIIGPLIAIILKHLYPLVGVENSGENH